MKLSAIEHEVFGNIVSYTSAQKVFTKRTLLKIKN